MSSGSSVSHLSHVPHVSRQEHIKHKEHRTPKLSTATRNKKPKTPEKRKPPTVLPADHAGVDRKDLPSLKNRRAQARDADDILWMRRLFQLSNLRFVGAYITGARLSGQATERFSFESRDVDRAWIPNVATLADQGWGIVFWYMGFSLKHKPQAPRGVKVDKALGTLHGRHLRTTLATLGAEWAGATVMIDQEDDKGTKFPKNFVEYYQALFEEIARPDKELPAFRPGMYCRLADVHQLMGNRPDLFLWEVKYDTATNATTAAPCEAIDPATRKVARRLLVLPEKRPISAAVVTRQTLPSWVVWAVGRQFCQYTGSIPPAKPILPKQTPLWDGAIDTRKWDFDTALVHNPAFPIAEPRLAAAVHAGGVVLLRGSFRAPVAGTGSAAHPALMEIEQMTLPTPTALLRAPSHTPAPEAPMLLLHRPHELLAVTVLRESKLGLAARSDLATPKKWSAIDVLPGNTTPVRRLYALAGVTAPPDDVQIFFIGTDQRLHACRSLKGGAWTEEVILDDERLHPFSQLAAVARASQTVAVFFIDETGHLGLAFWPTAKAWPSFTRLALEGKAAHFLPGTALAAVSPSDEEIFAFGVGRDLRLHFVSYSTRTKTWAPPAALGTTKEFVAPHARMAVHAPSADRIEVLAITDDGKAVLYPFTRAGGTLEPGAREVIAEPPAAAKGSAPATSQSGRTSAPGWRLNPFGDVAILRSPQGATVAYAAGLKGGQHQILRREIASTGAWEVFTA